MSGEGWRGAKNSTCCFNLFLFAGSSSYSAVSASRFSSFGLGFSSCRLFGLAPLGEEMPAVDGLSAYAGLVLAFDRPVRPSVGLSKMRWA